MTGSELDRHARARAVYVHIPFCSSVCPYCDFAVVAGADHLAERYVDAVVAEISGSEPVGPLDSVYFGGGTPSHVEPALLLRIVEALSRHHGFAADPEISIEANPEDFSGRRADEIRAIGFNRVSFGAQSFDGVVLAELGRHHDPRMINAAVGAARQASFDSVSLDLIYGTPAESAASWSRTLAEAIRIDPDHISCYALTVERGTPLARSIAAGAPAPDADAQADRYEHAEAQLSAAGFGRYEVSNWAKPGHECRYNLTVWAQGEYEAYGNGAHRFRHGSRSRNIRRLDAYVERVLSGEGHIAGSDLIEGWDEEIDRLFVGLRRAGGVARGPGVDALITSAEGKRLLSADVIRFDDDRLIVARPLLTDEVNRALLGLEVPKDWGKLARRR